MFLSLFLFLFLFFFFFFFNDTATTEIYTLSLHDALPILRTLTSGDREAALVQFEPHRAGHALLGADRKSTRLNSSHLVISYAVFCLKKKKKKSNQDSAIQHPTSDIQRLHHSTCLYAHCSY